LRSEHNNAAVRPAESEGGACAHPVPSIDRALQKGRVVSIQASAFSAARSAMQAPSSYGYGDEWGEKEVESKHSSVRHSSTKQLPLLLHSLIDLWSIIGRLSLSLTYGDTELLSRFSSLYS